MSTARTSKQHGSHCVRCRPPGVGLLLFEEAVGLVEQTRNASQPEEFNMMCGIHKRVAGRHGCRRTPVQTGAMLWSLPPPPLVFATASIT